MHGEDDLYKTSYPNLPLPLKRGDGLHGVSDPSVEIADTAAIR
jgi:hypothetical protein